MIKHVIAWIGTAALLPSAQAQPVNTELVVNGGAETGDTTGWSTTGIEAVPATGEAGGFGEWTFTGGTGPALDQQLTQDIAVGSLAGAIDAGVIRASFSISIQSRSAGSVSDTGTAVLLFLDGSGTTIDSDTFTDPVLPSGTWDHYGVDRAVPPQTRTVRVLLDADRGGGQSTDCFFDETSLRLLGCGPADLAPPFGLLDLADVNAFVGGFVAQDEIADLDRNGLFDLTDVTLFINAFLGGCPS